MNAFLSDTPQIQRGYQVDPKRVFYKGEPDQSLAMPVSIAPGYGWLPPGTIMAPISSEAAAARDGLWVPYAQENPAAATFGSPYAFITADGTAAVSFTIKNEDSYKIAVGDHLAAADGNTNGASAVDLGACVSITPNDVTGLCAVVGSNDITANITVAQRGAVYVQTKLTAPFTGAAAVLYGGVDTGIGADAKGAMAVVIISHAMLYKGSLPNYDAEALTDLGGTVSGQYLILK